MFDELKFLLQKSPSYFIFWVAQNCNFTCDHCFNYIENKKKDDELTLDEIDRFSKKLNHCPSFLSIACTLHTESKLTKKNNAIQNM